ncbi:response regulator transcription factor [Streptomyces sp. 549]|uniref:response regulator transcription factor n=1 Tax=Streptomyces sp. 549 TaxID=3049076 RepID=UPI0024C37824|nr:response regulator transcription factor [Streptomyces sp. 549]MDK1472249.1 response regulator transcription factor [Streptomyces sp. 549]
MTTVTPEAEPHVRPAGHRFDQAVRPARSSVLLADSDEAVAAEVAGGLTGAGIPVTVCRDGAEVLLRAGMQQPALVLLGAPLAVVDAATVTGLLNRICPSPVVVGVGAEHAAEAVAALSAGATALVARPYRLAELLPLLQPTAAGDGSAERLRVGDIELDPAGLHVYVRGQAVRLPLREFELLRYLMRHGNQVVPRKQILQDLWGTEVTDTNTLTVHVKRLRAKLAAVEGSCCTIDTVRGLGYRLECPEAADR